MSQKNVNKEIIAKEISGDLGISKAQSQEIVQDIIDIIVDVTNNKKKLRIPYFGTFLAQKKNSRVGRNPQTKKEYDIPAREIITFKPADSFKKFVNDN